MDLTINGSESVSRNTALVLHKKSHSYNTKPKIEFENGDFSKTFDENKLFWHFLYALKVLTLR